MEDWVCCRLCHGWTLPATVWCVVVGAWGLDQNSTAIRFVLLCSGRMLFGLRLSIQTLSDDTALAACCQVLEQRGEFHIQRE